MLCFYRLLLGCWIWKSQITHSHTSAHSRFFNNDTLKYLHVIRTIRKVSGFNQFCCSWINGQIAMIFEVSLACCLRWFFIVWIYKRFLPYYTRGNVVEHELVFVQYLVVHYGYEINKGLRCIRLRWTWAKKAVLNKMLVRGTASFQFSSVRRLLLFHCKNSRTSTNPLQKSIKNAVSTYKMVSHHFYLNRFHIQQKVHVSN